MLAHDGRSTNLLLLEGGGSGSDECTDGRRGETSEIMAWRLQGSLTKIINEN